MTAADACRCLQMLADACRCCSNRRATARRNSRSAAKPQGVQRGNATCLILGTLGCRTCQCAALQLPSDRPRAVGGAAALHHRGQVEELRPRRGKAPRTQTSSRQPRVGQPLETGAGHLLAEPDRAQRSLSGAVESCPYEHLNQRIMRKFYSNRSERIANSRGWSYSGAGTVEGCSERT